MKKLCYCLFLLISFNSLVAQHSNPRILCGNEVFSSIVREKYPELQSAFDATFEKAKSANGLMERSALNVNVVVHLVWNEPEENLDDSIIISQIQTLNEDFNRLNADTANLRQLFQAAAGTADIHFKLAEIVRVHTNTTFALDLFGGSIFTELKHQDQGGSDARDTEKFLNIWVCRIQPTTIFGIDVGQIFGIAFPPNGLDNWPADSGAPSAEEDGVVIDFRVFGRNNPNTVQNPGTGGNIVVQGRTPVHEVGHYFGLRHIWGDGGLLGPNDCAQSDGVDDTPFASAQSDFDCNTTKNSCDHLELFYNADVPDLIENFMDYSSEDCMNMFTKGQVEIMRNVLTGPRSGLLNTTSITLPPDNAILSIYPNPAVDDATVSVMLKDNNMISGRVLAPNGQTLVTIPSRHYESGLQKIAVDTHSLPAGLFFVELSIGQQVYMRKLCRQ